jgi:hypothetical protein
MAILLTAAAPLFAADVDVRTTYLSKLTAIVSGYVEKEVDLARWCRERGMEEGEDEAMTRARACRPDLPGLKDPRPASPSPPGYLRGKIIHLRSEIARAYADLAAWCLKKDLLFEARRCTARAFAWDRRSGAARRLAARKSLCARHLLDAHRKGVWRAGRFVPVKEFKRQASTRVERKALAQTRATGMPLRGAFLPGVDILTTVPHKDFAPLHRSMELYLDHVYFRYFLKGPAKPLLFHYVRNASEFAQLGQKPAMGGAYVWGKGHLYAYPGFMGPGTILHELTHALQEVNFKTFPPLWLNEGLACFFETATDLASEQPFGITNWRDELYATAVKAGRARPLARLFRECAMSIDIQGYGQGRTLMLYLWSLGQLEAFVITAQLRDKGKLRFPAVLCRLLDTTVPALGGDLEVFARGLKKAGQRIPRGQRPDEKLDQAMGDGPEVK